MEESYVVRFFKGLETVDTYELQFNEDKESVWKHFVYLINGYYE